MQPTASQCCNVFFVLIVTETEHDINSRRDDKKMVDAYNLFSAFITGHQNALVDKLKNRQTAWGKRNACMASLY